MKKKVLVWVLAAVLLLSMVGCSAANVSSTNDQYVGMEPAAAAEAAAAETKDTASLSDIIRVPFGFLLDWLYTFTNNYGLALILFSLIIKLVLLPMSVKSKKSMLAMSAMNAELQQLQKKYANNRVKLNEEMQKLYEKHGVSPMSGCLPNLIPLPIMMGLYYAVQQPLQYIVGLSRETVIALAQMIGLDQFAGANYTVQIKIAEKLNAFVDGSGHFSDAVTNCLQSGETIFPLDFHFFGLNLADTPSISHPSIIWIIPILSGLTAFLSSYIMQKMQGTQNSAAAGQMKMLNFMMPLMSLYFAFILPGAIGIYWIFNNVFTCVQEIILTKTLRGKQEAKQAAEAARIEAEKQAKREAHKAAQKQQSQNAKNKKGDK